MRPVKASSACCIALCVLLLSACDVTAPSKVHTGEIQIKDVMKTVTLDPARVNPGGVEVVAEDYDRNGNGPMRLVVPYMPGNPLNKVEAEAQGAHYQKAFADKGIKDFRVSYTATMQPGAMAVLSYMALAAEPPRNCRPSYGDGGAEALIDVDDGSLGCDIKSAQSKMIARPADLLGVPGTPDDDARRQGTVVEKYRLGTPNTALQGLSAHGG